MLMLNIIGIDCSFKIDATNGIGCAMSIYVTSDMCNLRFDMI